MNIIKKIFLISILSSNLYCSFTDLATMIPTIMIINSCLLKKLSNLIFQSETLMTMSKEEIIEYTKSFRSKSNLFIVLGFASTCTITVYGMSKIFENEEDNINRRILLDNINEIANSERNLDNAENINRYFVDANDDINRDYHHGLFHCYIIRRGKNNIIVIAPHAKTEDKGDNEEPRQGKRSSKDPYKVITMLNQRENIERISKACERGSIISNLIKKGNLEPEITYVISNNTQYENV